MATRKSKTQSPPIMLPPITLPPDTRVRQIASTPKPPFSATLSPAGLSLAMEVGYQPIAAVTGTSVIQVDQAGALMSRSRESPRLIRLIEAMWHASIARIQAQARILGASGVVGANVQAWGMEENDSPLHRIPEDNRSPLEKGELLRVSLVGTAVRMPDLPAADMPFVCTLTGQEVCALACAGFRPIGFAYGNCVWSQVSRQYLRDSRNKEVTGMTLAIYRARRLALERAEEMAVRHSGDGILGLKMRFNVLEFAHESGAAPRADVAVSFFAGGTVVARHSSVCPSNIDYSLMLSDQQASDKIFLDL